METYQFRIVFNGRRDQPVIVFLHGFLGNHAEFYPVYRGFLQHFCCLSVDLPGHGKTKIFGDDRCYTIPETATALVALLERLAIQKCFLVGYSMGGRLALYLTLHFPHLFHHVILESTSPGLKTEPERSDRLQQDFKLAELLETRDLTDFLETWYNQPLFKSLKEHPHFNQLIAQRLDNNPLELAKSLRYMGTGNQPSLWEKLSDNQVPILSLVGEFDQKFVALNQEMQKNCPHLNLKVIPNCGHNIHFENPAAWLDNAVDFFQPIQ